MRKLKSVTIDKRVIVVKELTVGEILGLQEIPTADFATALNTFLPLCTDLTLEALKELAPSEIRKLVEAFQEVNADFFETAGWLGLNSLLANLKAAILKDFSVLLADSLRPGTRAPSATDGPSS